MRNWPSSYGGQGVPPSAIWKLQTPGRAGGVIQSSPKAWAPGSRNPSLRVEASSPQHRLEGGQHQEQTPPPSASCSLVASGEGWVAPSRAPTWGRAGRFTTQPIQMLISSRNAFRRCTQKECIIQAPHVPVKLRHRNEPSQKNLLGCQSAESPSKRVGAWSAEESLTFVSDLGCGHSHERLQSSEDCRIREESANASW